jgi:guanine nucleotide-binding protein subunit alpha
MAFSSIMCFGNGNKEDPDAKKSKDLDRQIREDQKKMAKEVKLLLLGKSSGTVSPTAGPEC